MKTLYQQVEKRLNEDQRTVVINTHLQNRGHPGHAKEWIHTSKEKPDPKHTKDSEGLYIAKVVFIYSLKRILNEYLSWDIYDI